VRLIKCIKVGAFRLIQVYLHDAKCRKSQNLSVAVRLEPLTAIEDWVLGNIFGPRREELTGDWRKLHNEELRACTFHLLLTGYIKRYVLDGEDGPNGRKEKSMQDFGAET
jgi:hypothetical protein